MTVTKKGSIIAHIGDDEITIGFNIDPGSKPSAGAPGEPVSVDITNLSEIEAEIAANLETWIKDGFCESWGEKWPRLEAPKRVEAEVYKMTCREAS